MSSKKKSIDELTKVNQILWAWWCCWHATGFPLCRAWRLRVLLSQWLQTLRQNLSLSATRIPELRVREETAASHHWSILTVWQAKIQRNLVQHGSMSIYLSLNSREEQHLLDGTSPNISARHPWWTLKADRVLFHFPVDRVSQMYDEHFPLKIDFWYFRPSKMLDSLADRKRADAWEVDADVKLGAAVILHWVRVDAVRLEMSSNVNELIVDCDDVLTRFALPVRLDDFLLELQWLTEGELERWDVIFCVNFPVVVAELVCKEEVKAKR